MKLPISNYIKFSFLVLGILYPVVIYFGMENFDLKRLLPVLLVLAILRMSIELKKDKFLVSSIIAPLFLALFIVLFILVGNDQILKLYPLVLNISLLILFGTSLFHEQSFVEKIARLKEPNLPPQAVIYTRNVTKVWVVFFLINIVVTSYSIFFASIEFWTLYNGFISYLCIGTIALGEWIYRRIKVKNWRDGNA